MAVEADHGVSYDVCQDHGIWLDRGELAAVISSIRAGQRISRSLAIKKAKRDGQWAGAARGIWSLMFED
jgi:Zn-finger nucleic acid-binding protein